jgi:adenylate cyclase
MSCRASSYGVSTPSLPVVELLKGYFQIDDAETPSQIREKVSRHIFQLDNRLERHLPALFALLDVAVEDPQWHALDPRQRPQHTIAAVDHLLLQESLAQPLLVIFEDLHWVDTETQGLLDSLAQSLPAERVMLLVTYRPEYQHRWGAKTYFTQVRLDRLPAESTVELLGALLGPDPGLAPLKQMLVKRGNPFFLEEMVRTLVETGVLAGERGAYRLTCPVDAPRVPDTVQTIVAARIDRLPQAEKQLLQAASAIGKDVPYVLLAAIADQSEEALRRGLTHLQEAELLYGTQPDAALEALCELMRGASRAQVPVTSFDSYDRLYRFNHAIVQEVVYQNMLMKQREVLHSRVGEVLCAASGESPNRLEEVEALAHHFSLSDNKARAIRYLVEAGDWARRLYANDDALRHYRRAFAVLEVCATTEADRFGVLERLADLLAIAGQRDEALQHYQALLQLVASSDASAKARLHRKIAILYWEAGARDRAHAELQSALGLLQPRDHSIERAFLCHEMGRLAFRSGDHHRAMEWTERAIAAALPFLEEGSQSSGQASPKLNASAAVVVAEANNTLGIAYARVGQIDYAIAHVERSLQLAAVHGFDQAICRACANLGVLYGNRDPGRAIKLSEQGLEMAQRIGHMGLQSTLYTNLGVAFCTFHVRCDRKGVAAVKKSIELDRRLNLVDHLPMALIALGQLYQCHGQPRQAIDYYREALGLAEALDEPQVLFHCYDGLAAALLDVDDLASARDYLRKAQALCKRTGIDPASLFTMPFLC